MAEAGRTPGRRRAPRRASHHLAVMAGRTPSVGTLRLRQGTAPAGTPATEPGRAVESESPEGVPRPAPSATAQKQRQTAELPGPRTPSGTPPTCPTAHAPGTYAGEWLRPRKGRRKKSSKMKTRRTMRRWKRRGRWREVGEGSQRPADARTRTGGLRPPTAPARENPSQSSAAASPAPPWPRPRRASPRQRLPRPPPRRASSDPGRGRRRPTTLPQRGRRRHPRRPSFRRASACPPGSYWGSGLQ